MKIITSNSIYEAWKQAYKLILDKGIEMMDEDIPIKELLHLTLFINDPHDDYDKISKHDLENRKWMWDNFNIKKKVPELYDCWSYAWRLYDFQGTNQMKWIYNKLKNKPETKSATITMLQKAGIEKYIPCISLLDFKIRENILISTITCRSLDFDKKAIHNFMNIFYLTDYLKFCLNMKGNLNISNIKLIFYIISAHIYKEDIENEIRRTLEGIII